MVVAQHAGRVDLGGAAAALLALQHVQAQGAQGGAAAAGRVEQALGPEELQVACQVMRSHVVSCMAMSCFVCAVHDSTGVRAVLSQVCPMRPVLPISLCWQLRTQAQAPFVSPAYTTPSCQM